MKEPNLPLKKKYFYRFLVQNNALFAYLQYFKFESESFVIVDWEYWLSFIKMSRPLTSRTFTWKQTKEGYVYWEKLRTEWVSYLVANNYFKIK